MFLRYEELWTEASGNKLQLTLTKKTENEKQNKKRNKQLSKTKNLNKNVQCVP